MAFLSKLRSKVLNNSAEQLLCDSEFQTEGALTLKALADNESTILGTDYRQTVTVCQWIVGDKKVSVVIGGQFVIVPSFHCIGLCEH